jgi:anthranilate/para-aminobenzoate synthase component I
MTLSARELPLPPRPLLLARRLADEPELALLWSAAGGGPSFIGVRPLRTSNTLDPEPALPMPARLASSNTLGAAPRWMGFIPYEGLRSLERPGRVAVVDTRAEPQLVAPMWWRFGAVVCIGARVTVIGDDRACVDALAERLLKATDAPEREPRLALADGEPPERHAERVRAALDLIARGEIYQVNLARRLELGVTGGMVDVLARLCRETRPPYAAAFRFGDAAIVSTSPELLLRLDAGGRIQTSPIKGTRPRGRDAASDARWHAELDADPKERAELAMIIDVERNDVGKVSRTGSVLATPPEVNTHGLVWHRRAHVSGQLAAHVSRDDMLRAMLPSGSVTGAPKVRAMEIIAGLEAERRGLYTGGLGFITHQGEMTLSMAIRTLTVRSDRGHYFTGGGIVADSDPAREVEETLWKARQLFGRAG